MFLRRHSIMPMDLSGLRDFIEEEMSGDLCRITRDREGTTDDVYDEDAAEFEGDPGDEEVYVGPAILITQGWQPAHQVAGGAELTTTAYKLSLPLDSPRMKERDVVEWLESRMNPFLIGQKFVVRELIDSTHVVSADAFVERVTTGRPL
jgi:hypothetical protein